MTTDLRNRRKGKVKMNVFYKGKSHGAYLSHVKVQITASRKDIYLVLVYVITEHPMMLATNKEIISKDDVVRVARTYFSRWKIEECFRCKKQVFQFENFRVRRLKAIKALKVSIYKDGKPYKKESVFLLLPAGKRHLGHTFLCKRGCQALVPAGLIKVVLSHQSPVQLVV